LLIEQIADARVRQWELVKMPHCGHRLEPVVGSQWRSIGGYPGRCENQNPCATSRYRSSATSAQTLRPLTGAAGKAEGAGRREAKDEPRAAVLEGIKQTSIAITRTAHRG